MKTWVMPRKTTEAEIIMKTESQKMLKMVKKKSLFVNLHLFQCLFYIERRETWTRALI